MNKKPNIIFLMCDQLRNDVISEEGIVQMPNFEKLKNDSVTFTRAYSANAVCSPARASIMTGQLPHNHGVNFVTHTTRDDIACLRKESDHFARVLRDGGYQTAYFGKWHVERSENLKEFGYDTYMTTDKIHKKLEVRHANANRMVKYVEGPKGFNNKTVLYGVTDIEAKERNLGVISTLAVDYIENVSTNKPFCLFVSVPEPHDPYICHQDAYDLYASKEINEYANEHDELSDKPFIYKKLNRVFESLTKEEKMDSKRCYFGLVSEIDAQYGRIIDKLVERGLYDDTIIVLTSDHGDLLGAHGNYLKNIGAFEEVYKVPLVIKVPDGLKGKKTNAIVSTMNIGQTLLDLVDMPQLKNADGESFSKVIYDIEKENDFDTVFSEYDGGRVLLTQRVVWHKQYKFVFNGFDEDELYDLEKDPYELKNLISDNNYDSIVYKLSKIMWETIRNTKDESLYRLDYPALRLTRYGPHILDE